MARHALVDYLYDRYDQYVHSLPKLNEFQYSIDVLEILAVRLFLDDGDNKNYRFDNYEIWLVRKILILFQIDTLEAMNFMDDEWTGITERR